MSHNLDWLLGSMLLSYCISLWLFLRCLKRIDSNTVEEPSVFKHLEDETFPTAVCEQSLQQVLRDRQNTLIQISVNGSRLDEFYCLPIDISREAMNHYYAALDYHQWSQGWHKRREYKMAAHFASGAARTLQLAFDEINRKS